MLFCASDKRANLISFSLMTTLDSEIKPSRREDPVQISKRIMQSKSGTFLNPAMSCKNETVLAIYTSAFHSHLSLPLPQITGLVQNKCHPNFKCHCPVPPSDFWRKILGYSFLKYYYLTFPHSLRTSQKYRNQPYTEFNKFPGADFKPVEPRIFHLHSELAPSAG